MRTYNLYVQRSLKVVIVAVLIILLLIALLLFSGVLKDRRGEGPPWFVGVFFLAVAGFNGYYWVLLIPHTIEVVDDGYVEFVSLVRKKRVATRDIRSIVPYAGQFGFLTIRTDHGKVLLLNQFDGFHEFLSWLKMNNPSVELRGC
jgi:hypothetical protein